ncbi:MAG: hypothetical protein A2381_00710 [Bdellovibrionales bacterium RIFOXYB1_FULL_37_110]|nr:MAG: hypothetical protein A2417_01565 [Bdellovibrionales bacterium RIFOXYC1_FULL_37_79]OFZ58740.1 MAG: hypothetical protein A2381_00710 [Bdellovibrionales bacterium RIFOXYB1_FULL_37_110]OFZ64739.1 MAG: hypothetical protein A2577_06710 [Bdellovibrionales bacterium RIFOXYD1_FULL_36_51]
MNNKFLLLIFIFLSLKVFSFTFYNPQIVIDGIEYKVVTEDDLTETEYPFASDNFCIRNGWAMSSSSTSSSALMGPYAILDNNGDVVSTYKSEGNRYRFMVLDTCRCRNEF